MIKNANQILRKALEQGYAVPHFNVLDGNFIKNIIITCNQLNSPVIIAISSNSVKYIGGFKTFASIVKNIDDEYKIKVPVIIHLDHGSLVDCKKAINSGFTSVMYDGSKLDIEANIKNTQEIITLAKKQNISVEAEVGSIGGEEEAMIGLGEKANVDECLKMAKLEISSLAAGVNTIHGKYPPNWSGIDFELLQKISQKTNIPIVLHGGSGIPDDQMKKAIKLGISKLNVGTSLQIAFGEGVKNYIDNLKTADDQKWYDPRKICHHGFEEVKKVIEHAVSLIGSGNKNDLWK